MGGQAGSVTAEGRISPPVGRFAPSPTGPLHFGSLVAALGSWLFARSAGGRWLVRMEDLDAPRVVPGCADDILRTLETLGFAWDGGVVFQSSRTEAYSAALDRLKAAGAAYPCGCSRAEVSRAATAPHSGEDEVAYPGTCRYGLPPGKAARAWRVLAGEETVSFRDRVLGGQSSDLASTCGDFVVRRADGLFAYQLAVVVDDAWQGVTQVVRGADLLTSTARQIRLQRLLGFPVPEYAHLPLVGTAGGGKLSKRDSAVSLAAGRDLARDGGRLLASALVFLGQRVPQDAAALPAPELLAAASAAFDPARIPITGGPFPS
ncbi:MAG TPA: tRNA glutamyl-Q(34) synthetase GluQRS [Candidatus Deferrimicrobiaceae bacterium]